MIPSTRTLKALTPLYVLGGSLDRIYKVEMPVSIVTLSGPSKLLNEQTLAMGKETITQFVRVRATPHMVRIGCDACSLNHSSKNPHCHANSPESVKYQRSIYAFRVSGELAGRYSCVPITSKPFGSRGIVQFTILN